MKKNVTKMSILFLFVSIMCFGMLTGCGNVIDNNVMETEVITAEVETEEAETEEAETEEAVVEETATEDASTLEMLRQLKELEGKNLNLVDVYNEVATLAVENGWESDELTVTELNSVDSTILFFNELLTDPSTAEGVDIADLLLAADELIVELDTNIRARVSVQWVAE